jgi:LmbE family N-acetylglucosaminyl deacetylase
MAHLAKKRVFLNRPKGSRKKKEAIVVFSAHSDDFVIGAGGTLAKYVQEGKKVIVVIFTYGEKSHPWIKERYVQKTRIQEAEDASQFLGCRTIFLGLEELNFYADYKKKANWEKELLHLLNKERPSKIFTHSDEDPHPDHRAVNRITLELFDQIRFQPKPEVYIYSVWNPISFKTKYPRLYVNISKNFSTKLKTLRLYRSQKIQIAYPLFLLIFRACIEGWRVRARFGEKFFRIR